MPIPPLQHLSHDEGHDEHHETSKAAIAMKWVVIIAAIGGVVYFFLYADKEKLTERVSGVSELVNQFDYWIAQAAEKFSVMLD